MLEKKFLRIFDATISLHNVQVLNIYCNNYCQPAYINQSYGPVAELFAKCRSRLHKANR